MAEPQKLILRNFQSPGDVVMLTAAVRDLMRSYPGQYLVDVRTPCPALDFVTALLPNGPSGAIGALSPKEGTTSFDATFTPNGNYRTLTLQGKVGDQFSNVIIIEVTGQTKQQAEIALQAYIDDIIANFQRALLIWPAKSGNLCLTEYQY